MNLRKTVKDSLKPKVGERSFSLFETVIAIGMLASILLYVNGIQGQAIYSVEYQENLSKASWFAKGIMAKVEYEWNSREFKEMNFKGQESDVGALKWGRDTAEAFDGFTYKVNIEEWKLPLMNLILSGGAGGGDGESSIPGGGEDLIASQIKEVLGDELLKIAHVEVFWPEGGARRGSTELALLLANQQALDNQIAGLKGLQKPAKP